MVKLGSGDIDIELVRSHFTMRSHPLGTLSTIELCDARTPEPDEVFRDLTAITRHSSALKWDDQGRVLVATWAN